ncbi:uncharacterized protein LOC135950720 [Calliphora vicina]|uniref:uncharacterized protein LOC135950720 n=1 Tax=Calliphora vicina TaxID=7373 RepID=UPI00325ACA05
MPRESEKTKLLKLFEEIVVVCDLLTLEFFGTNDDKQRKKEDEILDDFTCVLAVGEHFRYAMPFIHHSVPKSNNFLTNVLPYLDENRFKQIVRVSWQNFHFILNLIKNDKVFNGPRSCKQFPVEMQLIIFLYRLGSSGEGASLSKIASLFGIGDGGTLQKITDRIFKAILELKKQFLYWPDALERKNMVANTFHELPHCIGYVDGTEIKLAEKPLDDPESYFSRKHIYSLKVQGICDHRLRVRHMVLGYPGSVHDARIYNNCELSVNSKKFLTGAEWLVGDSAYKLTGTVVTPFRANSSELNLKERTNFNKTLSRYRIRIEHCFGLMKERFNSLKELKIQIKNKSSVKHACDWILVCAILHNILLDQKEVVDFTLPTENGYDFEVGYDNEEPEYHSTVEGEVKRRALLELIKEKNE